MSAADQCRVFASPFFLSLFLSFTLSLFFFFFFFFWQKTSLSEGRNKIGPDALACLLFNNLIEFAWKEKSEKGFIFLSGFGYTSAENNHQRTAVVVGAGGELLHFISCNRISLLASPPASWGKSSLSLPCPNKPAFSSGVNIIIYWRLMAPSTAQGHLMLRAFHKFQVLHNSKYNTLI